MLQFISLVLAVLFYTASVEACDLAVKGELAPKSFGAGAHGGERLQSDVLKGLRQAAHVVATIRTASLFRATDDPAVRTWIAANARELRDVIKAMKVEWNDDKTQATCALVRDDSSNTVFMSRPRCQNITSAPKAGELLIHEAVHIMGIESETFAPAVAYTLYLAWEYSGHTLDHKLHSITTENAPAGREQHTGVWTNNELFVWGGITRKGETNTGGLYDHVLDSWRATSLSNSPSPRFGHTSVWSGTHGIIWGGAARAGRRGRFVNHYNDGALFDPVKNNWQPMSAAQAPSGRFLHSAVWTTDAMMVFGGTRQVASNRHEYLGDGFMFEPRPNKWKKTAAQNAPSARFQHTAVYTGNPGQQVIVWGGQAIQANGQPELTNSGAMYDVRTDTWKPLSKENAPQGRYHHTAIWTGSHMVVWGGIGVVDGSYKQINSGAMYDPKSDRWTALNAINAPVSRDGHAAVWTGSHMLIYGGRNPKAVEPEENEFVINPYQVVALWEPQKNEWSSPVLVDAWMDRRFATAAWTGHELVVWGGETQRKSGRIFYP